jgi:biopolymer transport protein ExbD
MRISGKRNRLIGLESVAMTDIVLNMFIFFFISFSLLYTLNPEVIKKLGVQLPKSKNVADMPKKIKVIITLTAEDIIYLNKQAVTLKELKERLISLKSSNNLIMVSLHADKSVEFNSVVNVLDILNEAKITPISIAVMSD